MPLSTYHKKRNFAKTPEPKGAPSKPGKKTLFVIQRHAARRLHYDFRLENKGALVSFAVPKEPSMSTKDKRLAVHTEDHPISYGSFEGVIPAGNYGAGNVEIWDKGFFANITIKEGKVQPLKIALEKGHLLIWIKGDRLRGGFAFNRMKDGKNWILIKMNDEEALENKREEQTPSTFIKVNSKTIEITNAKKEVFANIRKEDFVTYYAKVAPLMLPHVHNRPISMFRFPHGLREEGFFQKNIPDYFPKWMKRTTVTHKGSKITYVMANDEASLVYLSTQMVIPHIWPVRADKLEYPDKMIFDLDPSSNDVTKTQQVALLIKKFLDQLQLPSYIMTTGNKGYHIVVPLDRSTSQEEVRTFALKIVQVLAHAYPNMITANMRKDKREGRVFVDAYRNSPTHTAVAPYSVRASLRGGIAMPIEWNEVKKITPHHFTLDNVYPRLKKGDIWKGMYEKGISIKKVMEKIRK